jgi:L-ribulose-5-phosphate 4-epimerase
MFEALKKLVCDANLKLVSEGLVVQTFGNVSGIDRDEGMVVIKPSGVSYDDMHPEQMVVVSLADGSVVEGDLRPSSDTPTHLELYRAFGEIGGVVHTHSVFATSWAQACMQIDPMGTTHADYFHGPVPCTRPMTPEEIIDQYEANTGKVIVGHFADGGLAPGSFPGALVANHGPFTWGASPDAAVDCAVILEYVAQLAAETVKIAPSPGRISDALLDKHFLRKHGAGKYYGQDG